MTRFGPVSMTAMGLVLALVPLPVPAPNAWMTGNSVLTLDGRTGLPLSHPPLHTHHVQVTASDRE